MVPQLCVHGNNIDRVTSFKLPDIYLFGFVIGLLCLIYATEVAK